MLKQDEDLKNKIEDCIDFIYHTLLEAKYNFHIWLELFPIAERVHTLNKYKGFYIPTIRAHNNMLFVNIYKVLDKRKDSYHFNYLFGLLRELGNLMIDIESERKKIFENHASTIKQIRRYRHKQIAHIDRDLTPLNKLRSGDKVDSETKITLGEVKSLFQTLEDTINKISSEVLRRHLSFRLDRAQDSANVIKILKDS